MRVVCSIDGIAQFPVHRNFNPFTSDSGQCWCPGTCWFLMGVGQVSARLGDIAMGSRGSALGLNLIVGILLPCCFMISLLGQTSIVGTGLFVLGYGAVNGLSTLVRATLPLTLFDPRLYASRMGTLLMPSFFLSALAPSLYASFRERFGDTGMLIISLVFACVAAIIAIWIYLIGKDKQALQRVPVDITSNVNE